MYISKSIKWTRPFVKAFLDEWKIGSNKIQKIRSYRGSINKADRSDAACIIEDGKITVTIQTHTYDYKAIGKNKFKKAKLKPFISYNLLNHLAHEMAHVALYYSSDSKLKSLWHKHPPEHFKIWGEVMALFGKVAKKLNIDDLQEYHDKTQEDVEGKFADEL